jgi:hypothetical protein
MGLIRRLWRYIKWANDQEKADPFGDDSGFYW